VSLRLGQEVQALPRDALKDAQPIARERILVVAAALYDAQGQVLIAERPAGKHMAGRWEFPGGKVAAAESERLALERELREELGVEVDSAQPLMRLSHAYEDRDVELSLWVVGGYRGTPRPLERQRLKWVSPARLTDEDILEADRPFVAALQARAASA
jgi:8-oxo-dGTP diphosphatase